MADADAGRNQNFDLGHMKINYWLVLGTMVTTAATAQTSTNNTLPPIPAPAIVVPAPAPVEASTNAPAKKPAAKHHRNKKKPTEQAAPTAATPHKLDKIAFSESPVTLVPGPAVVGAENLNVRGQAGLKGEVVAHVKKGETVAVLGEITLDKHKTDEPAQLAKIALPSEVSVWVNSSFINATDKTVKPKKLNLRAGPSEDYSVLGVVEGGTVVKAVGTKGDWTKIEAPTNAYAFIAAMYLSQGASGAPGNFGPSTEVGGPIVPPTTIPATTLTPVAEPLPINNQPTTVVPVPAPTPISTPNNNSTLLPPPIVNDTNTTDTTAVPVVVPDANITPAYDPNVPRIVTHEGRVRSSISLVAPT